MIQRVDGISRGIADPSARSAGVTGGGATSFADELSRFGVRPRRDEQQGGEASAESTATVAARAPLGRRIAADTAESSLERDPLGPARSRRPIGTQPTTGSLGTDPTDGTPRTSPSDLDEPVQLTSRGGYRNEEDYIRDQGWTKHPSALYPDPAREGFWIDPVTGRSGNFPSGYVPGMSFGTPGAADAEEPAQPKNDLVSVEMARLGLDSTDRMERLQFVAAYDADTRNWLNGVLIAQGKEPIAEGSLDDLSDELATKIEARREKEERRDQVLADLAEGNGSVRGGPHEGTVPVFES